MFLAFNTTSDENGNKDIEKKGTVFMRNSKLWICSTLFGRFLCCHHTTTMLSKIIVSFNSSDHWDFDFIGNTHAESYYGYFQVFKHYVYVIFHSNIPVKLTDLLFLRCYNICWRTGWKSFRASSMGTISPSRASWWVRNTVDSLLTDTSIRWTPL